MLLDDETATALELDLYPMGITLKGFFLGQHPIRVLAALASDPKEGSYLWRVLARRENNDIVPYTSDLMMGMIHANALHEIMFQTQIANYAQVDKKHRNKSNEPQRADVMFPPGYEPPKPKILSTREAYEFFTGVTTPDEPETVDPTPKTWAEITGRG